MSEKLPLLRELFSRIELGTQQRENDHELPVEQVKELCRHGFTALRVPRDFGGLELDWYQTTELLIELAAADSAIPQIFRGHLAVVEDARFHYEKDRHRAEQAGDEQSQGGHVSTERSFKAHTYQERLRWFAQGQLVGNAWTEPGVGNLTGSQTQVKQVDKDSVRVTGQKIYTTGSIFADLLDVTAINETGQEVTVLVPKAQDGVRVHDDWDGFGQQQSGTGAAELEQAVAPTSQVRPAIERFGYQTALYQHVLNIAQAGTAQAAAAHAARLLAERTRTYSHGNAPRAGEDPQLLAVVGQLHARAAAAKAVVLSTSAELDAAARSATGSVAEQQAAFAAVERATAAAQLVVNELSLANGTALFDALGASAVRKVTGLDRYWRNARTIASHNPQVYKARILGDFAVNQRTADPLWSIGVSERLQQEGAAALEN
ncbi:acyl-CoA dehydrogenase family protein [Micrococcoides hystricis]|uniref:Dibenzothiophene monooxygenase n=1 Tax=Micrococcoides hystricis TaxID=1572761 RepID=A0ABV6PAL9_9MICC